MTLWPEFGSVEFMRYCPLNKNNHVAAVSLLSKAGQAGVPEAESLR